MYGVELRFRRHWVTVANAFKVSRHFEETGLSVATCPDPNFVRIGHHRGVACGEDCRFFRDGKGGGTIVPICPGQSAIRGLFEKDVRRLLSLPGNGVSEQEAMAAGGELDGVPEAFLVGVDED